MCKLIKMITTQNAPRATPPKFNSPPHTHSHDFTKCARDNSFECNCCDCCCCRCESVKLHIIFATNPKRGENSGNNIPIVHLPLPLSLFPCLSPSACLSLSCMSQLFSYALDLLCFRSFPPHLVIFFCQLEVLLLPAGATLKGVPRLDVLAS